MWWLVFPGVRTGLSSQEEIAHMTCPEPRGQKEWSLRSGVLLLGRGVAFMTAKFGGFRGGGGCHQG